MPKWRVSLLRTDLSARDVIVEAANDYEAEIVARQSPTHHFSTVQVGDETTYDVTAIEELPDVYPHA